MERTLAVFLASGVKDVRVGTLWARTKGARETSTFEYAEEWSAAKRTFALDPELPNAAGPYHRDGGLFNAFTDPAPDRWGQMLLRRGERARARKEGRAPRTLFSVDFLALVDDTTRLGALRFRDVDGGDFLTKGSNVPPLVALRRLLRATDAIVAEDETDDDLALLLAPGTSLGGARPKASVRDTDGSLAVAKFPSKDDEWPVTRWEATLLAMAAAAEITVPRHRLETVLRKAVLVTQRFDRRGDVRVPYMSGVTALAADDGETRSYLELADVLRADGSSPKRDLRELFRRIVFNVLVSNTDDHLRNHAFLRDDAGWRLAPAFDLNPMPVDVRPRVHALAIDEEEQTASLELTRAVAPSFGVKPADARGIIAEVAAVVSKWRRFGEKYGLSGAQLDRMESAFEHADLANAKKL